jgi:hypothetical protein
MVEQEQQEKEGAEADSEEYEQSVIDPHRITLLNEIEATGIHMASIRAKLQSVGDKLTYTSMIRSQLVRGNGGKPDLTIVRRDGPALICMKADDDTELSPDDSSPIARSCRPAAPSRHQPDVKLEFLARPVDVDGRSRAKRRTKGNRVVSRKTC